MISNIANQRLAVLFGLLVNEQRSWHQANEESNNLRRESGSTVTDEWNFSLGSILAELADYFVFPSWIELSWHEPEWWIPEWGVFASWAMATFARGDIQHADNRSSERRAFLDWMIVFQVFIHRRSTLKWKRWLWSPINCSFKGVT